MKKWLGATALVVMGSMVGGLVLGPVLHGQVAQTVPLPKELTSYRGVVKTVLPAIVSIDAERQVKNVTRIPQSQQRQIPDLGKDVPEEFRKFFDEFRRGQSAPFEFPDRGRLGFGSGFVVDPNGVIMTNYHVVRDASKVTVKFLDGKQFVSTDIHGDRKSDLAIIKIDTKGQKLPFLQFGDSDAMEIGDRVLAFGAPFGLTGTVTQGIISAKQRNGLNMNMYEDFLQTDAAINPGNSGGPLVNLEGKVVGINAAIKSKSGGFNGVGLAVASNLAKKVETALMKDGVVRRGYLGVQVTEPDAQVRKRLGLDKNEGVVVGRVFESTPAANAGVIAGDIIASVNGTRIKNGQELQTMVAGLAINKNANLDVLRDGKRQMLAVKIEEQPDQFGLTRVPLQQSSPGSQEQATTLDKIGVDVMDLTPQKARELGYEANGAGVVISNVRPNSLASSSGLRSGMLILKIDNQAVNTAEAARQAIAKSSIERGVLLQIRSPRGGTNYVLLQSVAK